MTGHPDEQGDFHGVAEWNGRRVDVNVTSDDSEAAESVVFARAIVASLPAHDRAARATAVRDLLAVYNAGWRHYSTVDDDGNAKDVSDEELSAAAFHDRLSLTALYVIGTRRCDAFYADGGLFWGHSVVVSTSDGGGAWDHAELFG